MPLHRLEKAQGLLWLLALLAGTDQGAVRDHIGYYAVLPHLLKYLQGLLWLLALLAGADQGIACNCIRNDTSLGHALKCLKDPLHLLDQPPTDPLDVLCICGIRQPNA